MIEVNPIIMTNHSKLTLIILCLLTFKGQKLGLFMLFLCLPRCKRKPPLGCRGGQRGFIRYESLEQHGVANRFKDPHHADKYRYHDVGILSTLFFHFIHLFYVLIVTHDSS